ncbi:prolyl 4-hydroxylase subunit alpha-1-like [Palaemon carinicauda]|uniref:prolyl 4-hydroxylase subunit alpha-1-like n=1 Tax=Palaemon carinicauda TaxID=392227 RepID=UPI0035B5FCC7
MPLSCHEQKQMNAGLPGIFILFGLLMTFRDAAVDGHGVSGELYSSLTYMNDLFIFDRKVGEILPFLPTYLPEVTKYKESYSCLIHDIATIAKGSTLDEGDFLDVAITGNPLHLFAVIKRLVLYWPTIKRSIDVILFSKETCVDKSENCEWWAEWSECSNNPTYMMANCQRSCGFCGKPELFERLGPLGELEKATVLPSLNDLRGASLALARLQQIYRIPIPKLANGIIANVTTCVILNVYDCIRIANESHKETQYVNAWQWYNYAGAVASSPEMKGLINALKEPVAREHDEGLPSSEPRFFDYPLSQYSIQKPRDILYQSLCRGNSHLSPESSANLKCYISSRGSPYLILRPIKVEQVSQDPEMYLFYDVISDKEGKAIKDAARSELARSLVLTHSSAVEVRVSQTAWLRNASHPYFPTIAKRISAVTGLHVYEDAGSFHAGEPLQVLSYGIGGHYSYHTDPLWKYDHPENWEKHREKYQDFESGDRLATWMFYVTDVEAGGRTAFPKAGVSVKPVKGSAVFWFNLNRNGLQNPKSEHGGCPVLLGHKWVANKWIREATNFMRRPCSLDEHE